ncbi:FAD-dependent oxidoreductase [Rhodococcus sp. D2-41]|uniref:FAD-dependent oxidoreductase n=1 Tax=Speluncibacter jeojiensis TaxID=2710754 RepID=A0A9X4RD47_9ACTN|nr:FAD-dependent oxidoreductase [Rhodococcus sp. D2-41]MDG3010524.1 FAD-dependent oxidoreductase [Rhodococcus sp. D2-41]MDG3014273.1 FAD-dependent oxidoreductase [Corynebacteriales bacterium D3-21]
MGRLPEHVVIVGAGMEGLATAWHLQEHGVAVSVVDRVGVAADSSWGNAGWLTPALTLPLPDPAVLSEGLRALVRSSSPLYVPPSADPRLLRFLAGFARHCTPGRWRAAMRVFVEVNRLALGAYDELAAGGVREHARLADPFLAAFATEAERDVLAAELRTVAELGGEVEFELMDADRLRTIEPALGDGVGAGLTLRNQRFLDPPRFMAALAEAVRRRGGEIVEGFEVSAVRDDGDGRGVELTSTAGGYRRGDQVVLATGARLNTLARPFGVRVPVQAGRGYSFSVQPDHPPKNPIYLAAQRVACTPLAGRLRVAGMMEFRRPDAPADPRRIRAVVDAARPMLTGIDWEQRQEEWVGSRPCTPDGLPLIGVTRSPRVHVAGGHGMWGIALGPLTGRLLAAAITGDRVPEVMQHFDPLR